MTHALLPLALGLSVLLVGCADDDRLADDDAGRPNADAGETESDEGTRAGETGAGSMPLELEALSYHLDWETTEFEGADAAAWEIETDLGYRVRLHQGWTTVFGMTLVPCHVSGGDWGDDLFALARSPFSIPVAHAGHSGEDDPSSNYDRFAEDLAAPVAYDFAEVDFEPQTYCQFHFVYGPANGSTPGLPEDADLVGKSVHVVGSWQGPEGGAWTEFEISVSHANGKLIDFADAEIGELGERPAFRLVRDWRRAFDGVDFVRASQWDLDLAVLANLVDSARLEIGEL